ncbi:MAG: polyprenyl synthetase family protein [Planctomycetes bacterium]|nr:polyprenyl synthetase family protein [Planctomycetota bacterium]
MPPVAGDPTRLHEAMRYSALDGGKRVRPALCLFAAEALGGERARALTAACAVELIHVYSLVHDDLPAMDDDDLRRGRPTSHKAFGEATAILVGDGLQTLAFEALARAYADDPALGLDLVRLLAEAAGAAGMVGGQALDMAGQHLPREEAALEGLHRMKTGALLRASVLLGARVAGARPREARWDALDAYARAVGLCFQVMDDVLDCTASTEALGKTAGKDAAQDKLTYVALLGLDGARAKAERLLDDALDALADLGAAADPLRALARFVVDRGS